MNSANFYERVMLHWVNKIKCIRLSPILLAIALLFMKGAFEVSIPMGYFKSDTTHNFCLIPKSPEDKSVPKDKTAPDFELSAISGEPVSLSALKGKVVVLNFWATWCPPCKAEMPSLNRLYKTYGERGFVVAAVSTAGTSLKAVKRYVNENKLNFQVDFDTDQRVKRKYGVFALPTSFLIDRRGVVVEKYIGQRDWMDKKFRETLEGILKK